MQRQNEEPGRSAAASESTVAPEPESWASRIASLTTHLLTLEADEIESGISRGLEIASAIVNAKFSSITSIRPGPQPGIETLIWDGTSLEKRSPEFQGR